MLDDGEDLPDSYTIKAPVPSSISIKLLEQSSNLSDTPLTLIVVAPKLGFLFDKVAAPITQLGAIQVKFDPVVNTDNASTLQDDEELDQTRRYFDYDTTAPPAIPEQPPNYSSQSSLLEIPIFQTTPSTLTVRLPNLLPSISHVVSSAIIDQIVLGDSLSGHKVGSVLILAPCEMSVGSAQLASLNTTAAPLPNPFSDIVSSLQPPHCIQGGPASVLTACESKNVSATALVIAAEGPLGHELVDRDAVPSLAAILNEVYKLSLSVKSFHQQGSGMYI